MGHGRGNRPAGRMTPRPRLGTPPGMDADSSNALAAFGFLTVLESPEHGLFGGYLVLSPQGRPLEFRCSTPVAASRAQEILYGPTLRPYLVAEVIGRALVAGAELNAPIILTDQLDMLPLSLLRPEEILYVEQLVCDDDPTTENSPPRVSASPALRASADSTSLTINGCRILAAPTSTTSAAALRAMLDPIAAHVFLAEPFERIRAALTEAQLASQDDAEYRDDRAAA
jgi:hypothetical protein